MTSEGVGHSELGDRAKGFVSGIASGLTKLAVGHPFDTVKVRLQCTPPGTYGGMVDCMRSIVRTESFLGMYKGCVPPAVGWMCSDSVLLGSLHMYKTWIAQHWLRETPHDGRLKLPLIYHGVAGIGAGWTNSLVTSPVELLKTKLQMQRQRVGLRNTAVPREFTSTWDCVRKVVRETGVHGLWRGLPATLIFRTSFGPFFYSYEWFQQRLGRFAARHRAAAEPWYAWLLSPASITFWSGGLAAEVFWFPAYPADVVKNRIMADSLVHPRYQSGVRGLMLAAHDVWAPEGQSPRELGWRGLPFRVRRIFTGYLTCCLRAFPTNAAALLAFESSMYFMSANRVM
ncbi:hypothetical protein MSPP1_001328 [Malassezia sp. CBS 17886]|nr:hypothetical protein MSPP1_001328 [Malassezia sp. CBS 17886]